MSLPRFPSECPAWFSNVCFSCIEELPFTSTKNYIKVYIKLYIPLPADFYSKVTLSPKYWESTVSNVSTTWISFTQLYSIHKRRLTQSLGSKNLVVQMAKALRWSTPPCAHPYPDIMTQRCSKSFQKVWVKRIPSKLCPDIRTKSFQSFSPTSPRAAWALQRALLGPRELQPLKSTSHGKQHWFTASNSASAQLTHLHPDMTRLISHWQTAPSEATEEKELSGEDERDGDFKTRLNPWPK